MIPYAKVNKGFHYILVVINVFSKFVWAQPVKRDYVRISKHREAFTKGYTPNWSNEIFRIRKVNYTYPTTYLLEDQTGQEIRGVFYNEELQKTNYYDIYLVEKILRKKRDMIFVKWLGLDNRFNSWINKNNVV
ncbi:hypothetical protein NQ318_001286 [Aromia moschata]|uniref:Chromo domain-containing protein n=1 Tax=Aromia moschata TaxID=1265417 RepID=A0AAV8ZGM2_9CUCU|nr:hypothetical protein NQ318_001286 [Aromia moschata]